MPVLFKSLFPSKPSSVDVIELWICRHGETEDNTDRKISGHNSSGLSSRGRLQAKKLGERLCGIEFEAIYTSDLRRAMETTEILIECGVTVNANYLQSDYSDHFSAIPDPLLREKGAGSLEGRPVGTCERMAKSEGVSVRQFRPRNGECWDDVAIRTRWFVKKILANHSMHSGTKLTRAGKPATPAGGIKSAPAHTPHHTLTRSSSSSSHASAASAASTLNGSSHFGRTHSAPARPNGGCGEHPRSADKFARRILVVTHGGTIREMVNSHIPAARAKNSAPNCSLTIMRLVPCQPPTTSPVGAIATSFYSSISGLSSSDMSRTSRPSSPAQAGSPTPAAPGAAAAVQYVLVTWADVAHLTADGYHDRCNEEEGEDA